MMGAWTTKPWGQPVEEGVGWGGWLRSVSETTICLPQVYFQETLRSLHGELQKLLCLNHGKSAPRSL